MATFRSNCLFWAVAKFAREGGYLAMRPLLSGAEANKQ